MLLFFIHNPLYAIGPIRWSEKQLQTNILAPSYFKVTQTYFGFRLFLLGLNLTNLLQSVLNMWNLDLLPFQSCGDQWRSLRVKINFFPTFLNEDDFLARLHAGTPASSKLPYRNICLRNFSFKWWRRENNFTGFTDET